MRIFMSIPSYIPPYIPPTSSPLAIPPRDDKGQTKGDKESNCSSLRGTPGHSRESSGSGLESPKFPGFLG